MTDAEYRVLLISNNALSSTGSNGRTLDALLRSVPASALAQFYITDEPATLPSAGSYFRITDAEAIRCAILGGDAGRVVRLATKSSPSQQASSRVRAKRTPARLLIREIVWSITLWRKPATLEQYIASIRPTVIMVQAGDSGFMLRLARKLSRKTSSPLLIFNSEDCFYRKHNYLDGSRAQWPLYRLWRSIYRSAVRATFKHASQMIYSCEPLEQQFSKDFPASSATTVLTPTDVSPRSDPIRTPAKKLLYAGNLGLGRLESLLEIARTLETFHPGAELTIFGPALSDSDHQRLVAQENVNYRGFAPYDAVVREMRQCDLVLHVDTLMPHIRRDIRFGFSTKVADCLASGTPMLAYCPPESAVSEYLLKTNAAFVTNDRATLPEVLETALTAGCRRIQVAENARVAALENHSFEHNAKIVEQLILSLHSESQT